MQPRNEKTYLGSIGWKVIIGSLAAFLLAIGAEFLAENGTALIDWEADWAGSSTALAIGMVVAGVIAVDRRVGVKNTFRQECGKERINHECD